MTNPLATTLNEQLTRDNPVALSLLSRRGREIFFPSKGIIGQTGDARGKRHNATIGIALEEDGSPMCLPALAESFALPPQKVFTYASTFGEGDLRTTWKKRIEQSTPSLSHAISLPVVTAGLTHALDCAGALFVDDGDAIVITDKFWGNYRLTFEMNHGGNLVPFPTFDGNSFSVSALEEAISSASGQKKIVLLNFPNNPCGYTPTHEEVAAIIDVFRRRCDAGDQIVVLIDDAYYGLVYEEGITTESLFGALAGLHRNLLAVKIDGATKEDYAWGLRVGFLTFGMQGLTEASLQALEHKAAGMVRGSISNACHHSQSALARLYASPEYAAQKEAKFRILRERYQAVRAVLESESEYSKYFTPYPFNSGYFLCLQLAEGIDAEEVRQMLLNEFDTGVISIGSMIRIAYSSLPTSDIPTIFRNLYLACQRCGPT